MKENKNVAIQGIKGSFHHAVAQSYYGEGLSLLECETFDASVKALLENAADQAVMAIENSIAGSIIPNYALIDQNDLQIVGEYSLSIHHNLMALPGQTLTDLQEVHSHPMALLQCKDFFKAHPHIRLVEAEDTADEARRIAENAISGIAAIASVASGSLVYGLDGIGPVPSKRLKITYNSFCDCPEKGHTGRSPKKNINKAALKFTLDHQRGSLAAVLNVMSDCQLNLTKIQSLPVIETPGKICLFRGCNF
jgi:prephenate dehydratase